MALVGVDVLVLLFSAGALAARSMGLPTEARSLRGLLWVFAIRPR